LILKLTFN